MGKDQHKLLIYPALQSFCCKCFYDASWPGSLEQDSGGVYSTWQAGEASRDILQLTAGPGPLLQSTAEPGHTVLL